ncbi:MAG: gliding motility protein GldN [Saprospiraceae bacterium]|nr:gliding motility protein GldN [Saprospiraceae bacterium]MBK7736596.1 gliding motility protein GldN [Saprospiraceae bacterium]MBK7912040.1 gliding motility protein GldN [Saprospiraceae bacterium]
MNQFKISFLVFLLCAAFNISLMAQTEEEKTEASEEEEDSGYLDDIVARNLVKDQRILDYQPIREADIVWDKRIWRVIDVREKMNLPFVYPVRPFFQILIQAAENGDIKIFREDNFKKFLTGEELDKLLHRVDTVVVMDPETYVETVQIRKSDIDFNDIKTYRVKEMWYFNKQTSRLECRVLGIAPIKDEYDDAGNLKYTLPMFWIYYPEARMFLSREKVFNDQNDAAPGTWADVFDSRFFSSFIIKESNVMDNRLSDIFKGENDGVKLLLESEKIKNEILNKEHDLWTY